MSIPTKPPSVKTIDWGAWTRQHWGDDWHQKDISYEWSNKRRFEDSGREGGPYTGTSGNG